MKNKHFEIKQSIKQFKAELCREFNLKINVDSLISQLVIFVDNLLISLYKKNQLHKNTNFCLLALGSYGRRELQLYSDIDILLLHDNTITKKQLIQAQSFIQDCWDTGLDLSHQLTTVNACAELASQDLTVISSILDMRLICGRNMLMEELVYRTHSLHMWSSHDYFFAKHQEQQRRYTKYNETAYNLEPNVKYGPGGLRDLQLLLSISKRHFGIKKLADVISCGFINAKEYEELIACQHFLWRVRFALHMLAEKREERLSFDFQRKLATLFGFNDNAHFLAIEQFMKVYFTVIQRTRELNEMLLQWFDETIVHHERQQIISLDNNFQLSNNHIEVKHQRVFTQQPHALLELFLWLTKKPNVKGVRANTIRLIKQHLYLIDNDFRQKKQITDTFLSLFKAENNLYKALHHMNRYGVLSQYLNCFALVTGQMQYDLFHVYTVDQHTLFVIRNISRFGKKEYITSFPLAAQLMPKITNLAILYLAALFHDIAKGRGGDHSLLGAEEALRFAENHHLHYEEKELLIWLVQNHLIMSETAQRKDIYDPKTIQQFCKIMPHSTYLDYLYLLTVADICATNPALWNTWKDSLLKELYQSTHQMMQQEKKLFDEAALIHSRKQKALTLLAKENFSLLAIRNLWDNFKPNYFLHEPASVIAQHTEAILSCSNYPLVLITPHHSQGGTEIFIYMPHADERFAITTTVLTNNNASIQEATITHCKNNFDLDSYVVLNEQHQAFFNEEQALTLQKTLVKQLTNPINLPKITRRRIPHAQAHFTLKPKITFTEENVEQQVSCLFLTATDRHGLLATISHIFLAHNIHLHHAKIATAGIRAEDVFFISNKNGNSLNISQKEQLKLAIETELT